ncbi:hypothetical protein D3C86_1891000 [compost metagenome]
MPVLHDEAERLHHADIGSQRFQRIEQRRHEGDHQEDIEQFLGRDEAGREDAPQRADRVARDGEDHEEGADDGRHDNVGPQDHRQDDDCDT